MLLPSLPLAVEFSAVWPAEGSSAVLHIVSVLSFIRTSIDPLEKTSAMHDIVLPLALVDAAVAPLYDANTAHDVAFKITFIARAICPLEFPSPMLAALHELTNVKGAAAPSFATLSMGLAFGILALVCRRVVATSLRVTTAAAGWHWRSLHNLHWGDRALWFDFERAGFCIRSRHWHEATRLP